AEGGTVWYFNEDGSMLTGWKQLEEGWYYFNDQSGASEQGWFSNEGKWYYFEDGPMKTGWLQENKNWYYLQSSGDMAVGKHLINGKWYTFKH
ncbi:glucan-binding protein, partial [Bacillus cereus]